MNKRAKSNTVRIIGGQWRGRKLAVLDSAGLRPSIDRVRETLFNWLMHDVVGARCLDLFAGSGALGLEALSRGAEYVHFVEQNPKVASALTANIELLGLDSEAAICTLGNGLDMLQKSAQEEYDLVFLDPPFDSPLLQQSINALVQANCLASSAIVYLEQSASQPDVSTPVGWRLHREGRAGQTRYALYHILTA